MKQYTFLILISLTIGLVVACNGAADKPRANKNTRIQRVNEPALAPNTTVVMDLRDECIRGQAEPIILTTVYPKSTFALQPDSLTAVETIVFDNGGKLLINNWGCEYYTLTFRFETARFQADISNIPFWYKKAVLLMSEVNHGISAPINLQLGINELVNHIDQDQPNNYKNLQIGQEIDFGGTEIREIVIFNNIEKLSNNKYALTITFAIGPL